MPFILKPCIDLKNKPDPNSGTDTQILFGEDVTIIHSDHSDYHYVSVLQKNDSYQGFVDKKLLSEDDIPATHRVKTRATLLFTEPNIKSSNPVILSLGSCLRIDNKIDDIFSREHSGYYVLNQDIIPINMYLEFTIPKWIQFLIDNFYHTPYLWGGRSTHGIDCSGLVQLSLQAFGVFLPRDTGPQEAFITHNDDFDTITSGHFIYWPGHVGIMVDHTDIIHANAFHMKTLIEPLEEVIKRNPKAISSIKRIENL